MAFRLLANMNISPVTVEALRRKGWDIVRVSELLPQNAADLEVLHKARVEGRTVVTQDLDFSALLALGGHDKPSLVTLRLRASDPETVTHRLVHVLPGLMDKLEQGVAVSIDDVSVRIRKLPIR